MAEYITANRWITGVATHKTKSGRILCTGFGCIGCFPQDFPETACELEVYDSQTGLLFAESWTNELSNESGAIETTNQRIKSAKQKCHFERKNPRNNEFKTELRIPDGVTINENTTQSGEFKKLFLTECEQETEEGSETFVETKAIKKENYTEKVATATDEKGFKEKCPLSMEKFTRHTSFHADRKVVEWEDCVCLFFALEYNHNSRRLSDFSILEIVNSLTTRMHLNEIKCVQRLNGLWHIVLRTREHLRYLLTNGMTILGKCYRVVQGNDLYCEKAY